MAQPAMENGGAISSAPRATSHTKERASGGEGGIRTHGTRKGSTVFETARFNHSRTSPNLHSTRLRQIS
jgi:hypothetical protein